MYNLENKFNSFYRKHVVLPQTEKSMLFERRNINIKRLKEGLKKYNKERGTDYKLAEETIVQGSVAMSTVTQNENNDYDIDVAIVFEKENILDGTVATKNMVVNALKKECSQFNVEPEAKTNCVRIVYAEGYHIDFAIYRRSIDEEDNYKYEHCGSEWRERDPRSITNWFLEQNKEKNYKLREVVRLLKMFAKSRDGWVNMPGGLIQSVLSDENFQLYDRIDKQFYYTIEAIKNRLLVDKEVYNPVDSTSSLKIVEKDNFKMENLYNRLREKLLKLNVLFDSTCTYKQAVEAWGGFFNHKYWTEQKREEPSDVLKSINFASKSEELINYRETEEFIQYKYPVISQYQLKIDCKVYTDKKLIGKLASMLKRRELILPGHLLVFKALPQNIPQPFNIFWKVKNQGEIAKAEDSIRGEIVETNDLVHKEPTQFKGNHYVECYIVKNGVCVAKERINVPIKVS